MADGSDLRAWMRQGVRDVLHRVDGSRQISGSSLIALMCAAALAPVVAAGVAAGPVIVAAVGVAGSVGANILTDVVKGAVERLQRDGQTASQASVEKELASRLEVALAAQGEAASALRGTVAAVLRNSDATGAVVEAAAGHDNENLLQVVVKGFAEFGGQFSEFAFIVDDVRRAVWELEGSLRHQQTAWRIERERMQQYDLRLLRVLEAVERQQGNRSVSENADFSGDPTWSGCPYLGLVPFEEQDARIFYGRTDLVTQLAQRLLERLDEAGILLVTGESGAGKSSLLRAGLMPRLAAGVLGPESDKWPRRVIRPTDRPLRELAMHLADMAGGDPISVYQSLSVAPHEGPMLAEQIARTATRNMWSTESGTKSDSATNTQARLVIIVDQLEDLFITGASAAASSREREAFITVLHTMATVAAGTQKAPAALIITAVRADFLGRLLDYPALKGAVDTGPFTVGPMSEAELRLAITGPASEASLTVESGLVDVVINDLRGAWAEGGPGSGVLPLMSQALAAAWQHRDGNQLTLRAYRRAGGVADGVNRSAQTALETLDDRQRQVARFVFTQLTVMTLEGQLARRRCRRSDLYLPEEGMTADVDAIVEIFGSQRLLVLGEDSIEISHDVLLHAWRQLRDWLEDDRLDRGLYSQLMTDATTWDMNERDTSYLYQPGRVAVIDAARSRWQNVPNRYPPLPATSAAFLAASHSAARRVIQRRRAVAASLVALTVVAIIAAASALIVAGSARRNAATANRQHAIALSRQLVSESLTIDSADPVTARRLAAAAWRVFPTVQAESTMTSLLTDQTRNGILPSDSSDGNISAVAFSPNGRLLATADISGSIRLWDPDTGQPRCTFSVQTNSGLGVDEVAFSPDSKLLATVGDTVQLWNLHTCHPTGKAIEGDTGPGGVGDVAFSPDGKLLATADADGMVHFWNPHTGQPLINPSPLVATSSDNGLSAVAFSPNSNTLAIGNGDGTVQLWNPQTGRKIGTFRAVSEFGAFVDGVAFSPDGKLLATADSDGTVRLWNTHTSKPVGNPLPASAPNIKVGVVYNDTVVAFSPHGGLFATGGSDGTVRLWNPLTGEPVSMLRTAPGSGPVNGVAFSPDGGLLAAADSDGTAQLWNPTTRKAPHAPLSVRSGDDSGVAFSPDGQLLATASGDGSVRLWNPHTGQPMGVSLGPFNSSGGTVVTRVAFSPDGKLLATGDSHGVAHLWNPHTGQPVGAVLKADPDAISGASEGEDVTLVAFSPDGKLLATAAGSNGTVRLWNPHTGRPVGVPLPAATATGVAVTGVAFSPDGELLATGDGDGRVRFWNPHTGRPVSVLLGSVADSGAAVTSMAFSLDGRLLAIGDAKGTVRLWNPRSGQPIGVPLPAAFATGVAVTGVTFSPDGMLLATASGDGRVQLWNPRTGQPVGVALPAATVTGAAVTGLAFSPDGKLLTTADFDGSVRTWQVWLYIAPYKALCTDTGPPTKKDWEQYAPGEPQPSICR